MSVDTTLLLASKGWIIFRYAVPESDIDAALRLIHLDIVKHGLPTETQDQYRKETNWFPHLRFNPEIMKLVDHIPKEYQEGTLCEPQILLQFPDDRTGEISPHQDEAPPWANGREYKAIVGIALSLNNEANGGIRVWHPFPLQPDPSSPNPWPLPLTLNAGDMLVFHPKLWHSGGYNLTGQIRHMVYFRFLQDEKSTNAE